MYADISRDSYDERRQHLRVIQQQGRALVDADFNEQTSILLDLVRNLNRDLRGPHWGADPNAFRIVRKSSDTSGRILALGKGHYYVGGIPCWNPTREYQPDDPGDPDWTKPALAQLPLLIYLDVWERHRTPYEEQSGHTRHPDIDPFVWDPALGHLDTTTRGQVHWRVRAIPNIHNDDDFFKTIVSHEGNEEPNKNIVISPEYDQFRLSISKIEHPRTPDGDIGSLAAGVKGDLFEKPKGSDSDKTTAPASSPDPCGIHPSGGYTGDDNQLFRVEVHRAADQNGVNLTFKWARDNASAFFPVREVQTGEGKVTVTLRTLGHDPWSGLKEGDWVELIDSGNDDPHAAPAPFFQVEKIDRPRLQARLKPSVLGKGAVPSGKGRLLLRRWDADLREVKPADARKPIALRDGVQVAFDQIEKLRPGDFWQIPARTLTADVIWPFDDDKTRRYRHPRFVRHDFAPLALIVKGDPDQHTKTRIIDLRRVFLDEDVHRQPSQDIPSA